MESGTGIAASRSWDWRAVSGAAIPGTSSLRKPGQPTQTGWRPWRSDLNMGLTDAPPRRVPCRRTAPSLKHVAKGLGLTVGEQGAPGWIDTHCHLDAAEFSRDRAAVRARATRAGVQRCVIPAVSPANFDAVRELAHDYGDAYALGIHPLYSPGADACDLDALADALSRYAGDPRLVAVGEIGLDFFVPKLKEPAARQHQQWIYREQLKLARAHDLPVLLHVRRSVDQVLKGLRDIGSCLGIAHAFNGSMQQAHQFLDLGLKLGFGGAMTFERASGLRRLARDLPAQAIVMETDAPDMPPHWIYRTVTQRQAGQAQGRNEPAEVAHIGRILAELRGVPTQDWRRQSSRNAMAALPRLQAVLQQSGTGDVAG